MAAKWGGVLRGPRGDIRVDGAMLGKGVGREMSLGFTLMSL